ncbi:prepilin-type N-terminal cleavage/methylation domain-containing protein [Thermodesulfovibrionales bacterium]|nr:prepilin-type N-terminal cleavage/methylation domain-containing protein [Thermodesulfovibrionales bacterium]
MSKELNKLNKLSNRSGFSLIEILISMAILGILLAAIAAVVHGQNKRHAAQNEIVEMQNNAKIAMDFVTGTLKRLDRDETDELLNIRSELFENEGVNGTDLSFVIGDPDFNSDRYIHRFQVWGGGIDGANTLTYGYRRWDENSWPLRPRRDPLALNITYFSLQRMNAGGNPVTSFADTDKIRIIIRAGTENPLPTTGAPGTMTLESFVFLRN